MRGRTQGERNERRPAPMATRIDTCAASVNVYPRPALSRPCPSGLFLSPIIIFYTNGPRRAWQHPAADGKFSASLRPWRRPTGRPPFRDPLAEITPDNPVVGYYRRDT